MPSYVNVPGLSGLKDAVKSLKENVSPMDVALGAVLGLVGGAVFKQVVDTKLAKRADAAGVVTGSLDTTQGFGKYVSQYGANLGAAGTGLALYAAQKGSKRGAGHLAGGVIAAVVPFVAAKATSFVLNNVPGLHGYVLNPYGMIANDPAYGMIANDGAYGMIANDPAYGTAYVQLPGAAMSELRQISHQIGEEADEYMV